MASTDNSSDDDEDRTERTVVSSKRVHLGKYIRREIKSDWKRLAYQLKLLMLLDEATEREVQRFGLAKAIDSAFSSEDSVFDTDEGLSGLDRQRVRSRLLQMREDSGGRRSLKLIKRRVRGEMCRLAEKVQLLRSLDAGLDSELVRLNIIGVLDNIVEWHASGRSR